MRQIIFAAACFCLLIVFHASARAQSDLHAARATFVTSVGGQEAGRESYTFSLQANGGLRADAEVSSATGMKQKLTTVASHTKPVSFTAEINGAQVYDAEFGEGTVKVHKSGQPDAELPTKATIVLENLVWHQFHFLFAQYDTARGGLQTFTFFSPSNQKDFEITVERLDNHIYMLTDKQVQTDRYRIVANKKLTIEAWVGSGRTPLLFYVAAQQIEGVRVGMEGLARQVLADVKKAAEYQPPAYAIPSSYTEKEVTVGAGTEWALPGTLTMPAGAGTFPAVVLVHGSGPNDRDETISASKPFRDLAFGLASQGIAVLRYDKRTRVYGAKLVGTAGTNFTVKEETVDDALAAVALLRQTPGIDPKRIFVVGHSLGAGLAPRIAEADPQVRGLVVMAGLTTPLEDTIVRQYEYLLALDGSLSEDDNKMIASVKQQTARVKQLTKADLASKEMLHGAPVAYWLDLRAYDAVATAQRLKQPMLVIQGERDYNVTMTDFAGWQRLAARKKNVTTKSYPKLDHLFLEGEGPSSDAQYAVPRNIPKYVIDDIAAFVKGN
jgi:dienelactone hydrolase